MEPARPPYAAGLDVVLEGMRTRGELPSLPPGGIAQRRAELPPDDPSAFDLTRHDHVVPSAAGLAVSVFEPRHGRRPRPAVLWLHGGGQVLGDRFTGVGIPLAWAVEHGVVVITPEYRLAPEHPAPAALDDGVATLEWIAANADDLGIRADFLLVAGESAGAGLAAGVALRARDRGGPRLRAQVLICPMLDDRLQTVSARQFDGVGTADRGSLVVMWDAILGPRRGTPDVPDAVAPARSRDLARLPPAYLDVGSAEVFRDETVEYAARIWAAGGDAELHVWPGGTHTWEKLIPGSPLAAQAVEARSRFIARHVAAARAGTPG